MKRTTIRTLALVLCTLMLIPAGTAAKGNKHKTDAGTDSVLPMSKVHEAFPAAKSCKKSNNGVYKVYGKNDKVMGALVVSTPFAAGIKGFAGPTPLLIAVGKDMHVKSVNMLPNAETPNFQQHVVETGLLKTWNGLTLKQAASKDVDAVTGATFTSTAVIRTMRNAASSAKVDMKEDKKEETGKADSVKLQAQKAAKAADSVAAASNAVNIDSAVATSGTDTSAVAAAETETAQPEVDDAIPTSVWIKNISTVVVALLGLVLYFRPSLGKKMAPSVGGSQRGSTRILAEIDAFLIAIHCLDATGHSCFHAMGTAGFGCALHSSANIFRQEILLRICLSFRRTAGNSWQSEQAQVEDFAARGTHRGLRAQGRADCSAADHCGIYRLRFQPLRTA
jgi:Na+-translocating ferredoxin:NAD+ oxidoreductase RnfG subunit